MHGGPAGQREEREAAVAQEMAREGEESGDARLEAGPASCTQLFVKMRRDPLSFALSLLCAAGNRVWQLQQAEAGGGWLPTSTGYPTTRRRGRRVRVFAPCPINNDESEGKMDSNNRIKL